MQIVDLLQIPTLKNSRLVAGLQGVKRTVNSVNMMDAPDIANYLKANELLLTTAYAVKDQPDALYSLVVDMAKTGCAGLAIKTKRFFDEIPAGVIEEADRLGFPLIELPLEHSLGEILNQALSCILQQKTDELSYALETHQTFFNLILKGNGISEIIETLSELIAAPIVIVNPKFELISMTTRLKPDLQSLNLLIGHLSSLNAPINDGMYPIIGASKSKGFPYAFVQLIPSYQWQGYIVAFVHDRSAKKLRSLALEQAAYVLAFEFLKVQAVKDRESRFKTEFFTELIQGEIETEEEIIHRGKQYGLFPSETMLCIAAGKDTDEDPFCRPPRNQTMEHKVLERDYLYQVLKKEYSMLGAPFVLFTNKDELIAIVDSKEFTSAASEARQRLTMKLSGISETIAERENIRFSFGIGNPFSKLSQIPIAYKQAMDAMRHGRSHSKRMFIQYYRKKELSDLLKMIPADDLNEYVQDTFTAWNGLDENELSEWQRTLSVFYDNHCHIGETAKQLFIHRNTVLYRLNRIEQLTGMKVRNPAESLSIRMALFILKGREDAQLL